MKAGLDSISQMQTRCVAVVVVLQLTGAGSVEISGW